MHLRRVVGLCLLCAGFAPPPDPLAKNRVDAGALEDGAFDALVRLDPAFAANVRALAAVPPGARVAVVQAAATLLKTWTTTDAFKQRYAAWRAAQLPPAPTPAVKRLVDGKEAPPGAEEQKRFAREKAAYEAAAGRIPADPRRRIRALLERFLDQTRDVDFKAALRDQGPLRVFVKPQYERKPPVWKAAFRAGAEATGAARAFAKTWLGELPG